MASRSTCALVRLLACIVVAATVPAAGTAQLATDRGVSIVLFPKVIADASADTVIQLGNLADATVGARCAYVTSAGGTWQATTFSVQLGPRRTLQWTAARARSTSEPAAAIPAAPADFRGELLCVQVDISGAPFGGNELAGQASLHDLAGGDVRAYVAPGLRGSGLNDGDDVLCIGGEPSDACLIGAEYDPCPAEWIVSLLADGASDPALGESGQRASRLTVVPCAQDLTGGPSTPVVLDIAVVNALGQQFTAAVSATGWTDLALADVPGAVFSRGTLGSDVAEARLTPAEGSGGFILLTESSRVPGASAGTTALVPHHRGGGAGGADTIIFPSGGLP